MRVVIVGAGASGMTMAIKLRELGFEDFVILERAAGVGGTWHNNRYPGLACDVPSILYCLSYEQKSDWRTSHASQPEIETYLQQVAEKYDLLRSIRFETEVISARWAEDRRLWCLGLADGSQFEAEIFVSALGMFNELSWPEIPGLEDFEGELIHPGRWPEDVQLGGRTVGVIGTAASAVQIVPEILGEVERLFLYQRTPHWVFPKEEEIYEEAEREERRRNPAIGLAMRRKLHDFLERWLSWDNEELLGEMRERGLANLANVKDPELRELLYPTVPIGSQRTLISDKYYQAFNHPNLELVTASIDSITPSGLITADGAEGELDVLICATGWKTHKFVSVLEVTGRDARSLEAEWGDDPQAYKGVAISGYPNLFMLYGPNSNQGSVLTMLEMQVDYVVSKIAFMLERGVRWMDVRPGVMATYNEEIQRQCDALGIYDERGSKYYRSPSGRIVTQYPGLMADYLELTTTPDEDAFEYEYHQ